MANRDIVNNILKQHMLDVVLPKVLPKYNAKLKHHDAFMVIIGGVSVEMCARLDKNAAAFLKNVFSEDIDIKIVVNDEKADSAALEKVHEVRMKFVDAVMRKLRRFIKEHTGEWDRSMKINVILDDSLLNHQVQHVRDSKVVGIGIDYVETKYRVRYPLVDTSLYTHKTHYYNMYRDMMKADERVPHYEVNGVTFASCEYMMFDNCRMLVERANYLKEKKSLFALMKFTKYVIKFMSLYVLRKQLKQLPKRLLVIYEDAYKTLRSINTFKLKNGFKKMYSVKYDESYVNKVVSKLETLLRASNMKGLMKASSE